MTCLTTIHKRFGEQLGPTQQSYTNLSRSQNLPNVYKLSWRFVTKKNQNDFWNLSKLQTICSWNLDQSAKSRYVNMLPDQWENEKPKLHAWRKFRKKLCSTWSVQAIQLHKYQNQGVSLEWNLGYLITVCRKINLGTSFCSWFSLSLEKLRL